MAGIGFELRKILKEKSFFSLMQVYGYSALLSAGPWVISIVAILVVGLIQIIHFEAGNDIVRFQIIVTYAFVLAATLVTSGFLQLPFTRYIADLIYAEREDEVLGTYFGVLIVIWVVGLLFFSLFIAYLLPHEILLNKILIIATFLVLSSIWISNTLVSSLKFYKQTILAYFVSYGAIVAGSYFFGGNLSSLLFVFFFGNTLLLSFMIILIIKSYQASSFLSFDFFNRRSFYYSLGLAGLFYNLGTWIDKLIFWYHPLTGEAIIGNIHASVVYDIPVFLAYLSIVPGMAIFFFRLEADFAEKYDLFYSNVRETGTLEVIQKYRYEMADVLRHAIRELIIFQAIIDIVLFLMAPRIFSILHLPQLYLGLFYILAVGAMLQLCFMSILAVFYYLDRKHKAMWLSLLFLVLNALLTWYSIQLGPDMYGYGYALSLLISLSVSFVLLQRTIEALDYETYMHQ
jgi:uncharacterized membrane protein